MNISILVAISHGDELTRMEMSSVDLTRLVFDYE